MTVLIMSIHITLKKGNIAYCNITYCNITYNWFYFLMTLLRALNKNINVMSNLFM